MRVVFIGTSKLVVSTARRLLDYGNEVVLIEKDKQRLEELSKDLDCGFLHGDGTRPAVLREAGPEHTDYLLCLTDNDQDNIIASLVGRSLGFPHVITKLEDEDLEHICVELGLENTIVPTRTIARFLTDMVSGRDIMELSTMIKDAARFFSFVAREEDDGALVADLDIPANAKVICFYRDGKFNMPSEKSTIKKGDEVVVLTHRDNIESLRERFTSSPKAEND